MERIKQILKSLGVLIPVYFILRTLFLFFNWPQFSSSSFSDLLIASLYGIRFDIAAIAIINLPFVLVSLLPLKSKNFYKLSYSLFFLLNIFSVIIFIGDYEYFQFIGRKVTADVLVMISDVRQQFGQFLLYYFKFVVLFIVIAGSFFFLVRRLYRSSLASSVNFSFRSYPFYIFLVILLLFVGMRGGLQRKSIRPNSAYIFKETKLAFVALNPVYSLLRTVGKNKAEKFSYYKSNKEIVDIIKSHQTFKTQKFGHKKKQNVVILLMESFSYEYVEQGYTPFLASLMKKSLSFKGYANGRRSIESISSIFSGIPSVFNRPLAYTYYQMNTYYSIKHELEEYSDFAFYHGGMNTSLGLQDFVNTLGISQFYGLDEYPRSLSHKDTNWGIFDHYYFDFFADELIKTKTPFVRSVFSISSHQPYEIPKEFRGKFKKGDLEIHESLGYADYSLEKFFEKVSKEEWFENTLFVITADHTSKTKRNYNKMGIEFYRIPVIFYHPKKELKALNMQRAVSHVDILPSILDFLDIEHKNKLLLGNSIFSNKKGYVLNKIGNEYSLLENHKELSNDAPIKKAYIQYFINGLVENNIYQMK